MLSTDPTPKEDSVAKLRDAEGQVVDDLKILFVRVPAAVHEDLREQAARVGQPLSELVRSIVARHTTEAQVSAA